MPVLPAGATFLIAAATSFSASSIDTFCMIARPRSISPCE